jgi:hypothetical protein
MKTTRTLLLGLLTAVFAACGTGGGPGVQQGEIENALTGDFGDVSASEDHTAMAEITRYGGEWPSLNIMLTAPNAENGAVMGGVFLSGLDLEALPVGSTIRADKNYGWDEPFFEEDAILPEPSVTIEGPGGEDIPADDVWIDGIGCSGDNPGEWEKDEPAEEIIIEVIEGEEGERGVVVILDFASDQDNLEVTAVLENIQEFDDDYFIGEEPAIMPAG